MTDDQKFLELLKALGKVIADLNSQLELDKWVINDLKKKLEIAEAQNKPAEAKPIGKTV